MAEDHLKKLKPPALAAWYRRLAKGWAKKSPGLSTVLASEFLLAWLDNRQVDAEVSFPAPEHLRTNDRVREVQGFHRRVFLTQERARVGGTTRRAGIVPRLKGEAGFEKWDGQGVLKMSYESLCDVAPNIFAIGRIQRSGTPGERDLLGSLRGFQLKSEVGLKMIERDGSTVKLAFTSWQCSGTDRYDWNYSERLTVPNPDYQSTADDAVRPKDRTLTVFHSNAKRLEDAKLAAPYRVLMKPWQVRNATLLANAEVQV